MKENLRAHEGESYSEFLIIPKEKSMMFFGVKTDIMKF